jgi:hypothetical protein
VLALHERGEARAFLAARDESTGIVACIAADVVGRHLDTAFPDGRAPHEVDGKPSEVRQAVVHGGALNRTAH